MIALRDLIEGFGELKAFFTASRFIEETEYDWRIVEPEMVVMVGSWEIPGIYQRSDDRSTQYINPNYKDKRIYPEVYAKCSCGAVLSRSYNDGLNRLRVEHEHSDDCPTYERLRARANLLEKRERVMKQSLRLGIPSSKLGPRVGLGGHLGTIAKELGIDIRQNRLIWRRNAARSYLKLQDEELEQEEIARAYGVHKSSLRRWLNQYTKYSYDKSSEEWIKGDEQ